MTRKRARGVAVAMGHVACCTYGGGRSSLVERLIAVAHVASTTRWCVVLCLTLLHRENASERVLVVDLEERAR